MNQFIEQIVGEGGWQTQLGQAGLVEFATLGMLVITWVVLAVLWSQLRRAKAEARTVRQRCDQLSHDLQVAGNGAIGMGQRIITLERKLAHGSQAPMNTAPASPSDAVVDKAQRPSLKEVVNNMQPDSSCSFEEAKQLLQQGADETEVAHRCGLTSSEAALMAMVQRQQASALAS